MNVLIISPHLDDETLGAGGTLSRYAAMGHNIFWINIANTKEEYGYESFIVQERERQRQEVIKAYPIKQAFDLKLKPAKLGRYQDEEIIRRISPIVEDVQPEILILPYLHDVHSDHGVVFRWCLPFTKSFRYNFIKRILMMEIVSETDFAIPENTFKPDFFVDISDFIDKKIELLKIYEQELKDHPFPRSVDNIKSLAHVRGAVAGVQYAEAFKVLRYIDK